MNVTGKLENLNEMSMGSSRLGLPAYNWWNEGLYGVGFSIYAENPVGEYSSATSFATPLLLAAAFDDEMVYQVADAIGTEARAFGNGSRSGLDYWTPNSNPYRDPHWGRGSETPGEDPRRIKGYAAHFLRGLEEDHGSVSKVLAPCKHYVGYDLEPWNGQRHADFDSVVVNETVARTHYNPTVAEFSALMSFGYGLHYNNFSTAFSRKTSHNNSLSQSPTLDTYRITDLLTDCNTPHLDLTSDFVVLGFVASKNGPSPYPIKQLAAYTRVKNIVPQETRSTALSLTLGDLARMTDRGDRVLYPGRHEILIDVPTQSTAILELQGIEAVPDEWPQP